ncbi:MAG: hypothetical protein ACRDU5_21475 [Mycobacterium sp.]
MNRQAIVLPAAADEPVAVKVGPEGIECGPIGPAVDRARDEGLRLIVLAATSHAAEDFAWTRGLPARRVIYGTPQSVRGWTNPDVVVLPGWHERRDAERTWAALLPCFVTRLRKESAR